MFRSIKKGFFKEIHTESYISRKPKTGTKWVYNTYYFTVLHWPSHVSPAYNLWSHLIASLHPEKVYSTLLLKHLCSWFAASRHIRSATAYTVPSQSSPGLCLYSFSKLTICSSAMIDINPLTLIDMVFNIILLTSSVLKYTTFDSWKINYYLS
jgi:hypothetical protein